MANVTSKIGSKDKTSSVKDSTEGKTKKTTRIKPIRVLILEPKGQYCKIVWCAIAIGITHLLLGATNMAMLMYSLQKGDIHVSLCTIAYHFFAAEAILALNYANGWSSPMRSRHKRFAHIFLQMFGLICSIIGAVLITVEKGISGSAHGVTGVLTTVLAIITSLTGPCTLFGGRYLKILHLSLGIPTFLISSLCLCFGAYTSSFQDWAGSSVTIFIIAFVVFYTTYIVVTSFMKCVASI